MSDIFYKLVFLFSLCFAFVTTVTGQDIITYDSSVPVPTLSEVQYGDHERHVLDVWLAESDTPTPAVIVIHGGSWKTGQKEFVRRFVDVEKLLNAKVSVVAINYRLMKNLVGQEVSPPVKAPMYDAARALQFVRSNSKEWNIDKYRIGAAGASAGGCTGLWLAYHDDLADPDNEDPVARESTRLFTVAVMGPQTTLDPKEMKEWTPNSKYGAHAFGLDGFEEFLSKRDSILPWIREYSPYGLVSPDDPPVFLHYNFPPAIGQNEKDPTHSANFGYKLKERCDLLKIECDLYYPNAPNVKHETPTDYLVTKLIEGKN